MWKLFVGAVLIIHGLIHIGVFLVPTDQGPEESTVISKSWLAAAMGLESDALKPLGALLAIVAISGFVLAGISVFDVVVTYDMWRSLAIASAAISAALIVVFWNMWSMALGLSFNMAIIASIALAGWPSDGLLS